MTKLIEQVTLNGKIPLMGAKMTDEKLIAADKILEGVRLNQNSAVSEFKDHLGARLGEAIHTTGDDFIHAFAQLTALEVVNEWEAAERTWADVIETETFSNFRTPVSYTVTANVSGFERPQSEPDKPGHIVPRVPEGSPYPSFLFSGEAAESGEFAKAGGRYDLTFEKIIEDVAGIVPVIPELIRESLLERQEYDAWHGLVKFVSDNANVTTLLAGESLDGQTTLVNAPISREALAVALMQGAQREIRNKPINVSSWNLVVPTGNKIMAEYLINTVSLVGFDVEDTDAIRRYTLGGFNPLAGITGVFETDYLTGTEWMLIPAKGAIRGREKFYKLGLLRGHEGPELRVQNLTGNYVGGGAVPPFEGSFDTDGAAFRGRIIGGGLGWRPEFAVYSDGTGK